MIKRSPQEIADFFGCEIEIVSYEKAIALWETGKIKCFGRIGLEALISSDSEWKKSYKPRNADSVNKPDHSSEVFIHKEYVVAEGSRTQDLSKKVNTLLSHGWKLQGGVAIEHLPESDGYAEGSAVFYQAMVRGV